MACAPESVTAWVDDGLELQGRTLTERHLTHCRSCVLQAADEVDVKRRLKALPEPALPAGLELRVREFLRGRRGFAGH